MKTRADTYLRFVLSDNLKRLRKARGWTQIQLGSHSELTQTYISRIELGKVAVSIDTIQELAEALGCPPADLLTPENPNNKGA